MKRSVGGIRISFLALLVFLVVPVDGVHLVFTGTMIAKEASSAANCPDGLYVDACNKI
jgi:hypothetical protein